MLRVILQLQRRYSIIDYTLIKQRLLRFPYQRPYPPILEATFENQSEDFFQGELRNDMAAFACLEKHSDSKIQQIYKKIFNKEPPENLSPFMVFSQHFNTRLDSILEAVNHKDDAIEIDYGLKVLMYLSHCQNSKFSLDQLDIDKIKKKGNLAHRMYLLGMYLKSKSSLSEIQEIFDEFMKAEKDDKVQASQVLLEIPDFYNVLPEKMVNEALISLQDEVEELTNPALFYILRTIYPFENEHTVSLVEKITQAFMENTERLNVSLARKLMKIRSKFKLPNEEFVKLLEEEPVKFATIFKEKNSNKMLTLNMLTEKSRYLTEEYAAAFNEYVMKEFQQLSQEKEIDLQKIEVLFKNTHKFFINLRQQTRKFIQAKIYSFLIPSYGYNITMLFWSVTILFQSCNFGSNADEVVPYALKAIKQLERLYRIQSQKDVILSRIIDLQYQLARFNKHQSNDLVDFFSLDFRNIRMMQSMNYLGYLILKKKGQNNKKQATLLSALPQLNRMLDSGKMSFKMMATWITNIRKFDAGDKKEYKYFWRKIENHINEQMVKKFKFPKKDLHFLMMTFEDKQSQFPAIYGFLCRSFSNYSAYDAEREKYLNSIRKKKK